MDSATNELLVTTQHRFEPSYFGAQGDGGRALGVEVSLFCLAMAGFNRALLRDAAFQHLAGRYALLRLGVIDWREGVERRLNLCLRRLDSVSVRLRLPCSALLRLFLGRLVAFALRHGLFCRALGVAPLHIGAQFEEVAPRLYGFPGLGEHDAEIFVQ